MTFTFTGVLVSDLNDSLTLVSLRKRIKSWQVLSEGWMCWARVRAGHV